MYFLQPSELAKFMLYGYLSTIIYALRPSRNAINRVLQVQVLSNWRLPTFTKPNLGISVRPLQRFPLIFH